MSGSTRHGHVTICPAATAASLTAEAFRPAHLTTPPSARAGEGVALLLKPRPSRPSHRSSARQTYDARAEEVLSLFAEQAAVLQATLLTFTNARKLAIQLSDALANRDVNGQANRVLMARGVADEDVAFAMLVPASRTQLSHTDTRRLERLTTRRSLVDAGTGPEVAFSRA